MTPSSRLQRRRSLRKKLHILRTLTNSTSVKKSSIIMDSLLYICKLKVKLEALRREYYYICYSNLIAIAIEKACLNLIVKHIHLSNSEDQEVKVEKNKSGDKFVVRVRCRKAKNGQQLVSILEAFEEMGLLVLEASVACNCYFAMEAVAVRQAHTTTVLEARDVTRLINRAIGQKQTERESTACKS